MSEEIYEERFTKDSKILIDIREIAERFGYSRDLRLIIGSISDDYITFSFNYGQDLVVHTR